MKPGGSISSTEMVLTCGYAPDFDMIFEKLRMKSRPHMVIKCSLRTLNPASLSFQPMAGWCSIFLRLMRLSLSHLSGSGNLASMPLS